MSTSGSSSEPDQPVLSVVLNAMGRLELADYGFRSWMLQDTDRPYEVVLNLFNDQRARYEALAEGRNPLCRVVINEYDRPAFFNISAANNLGLHAATGRFVAFLNSDVIYVSDCARRVGEELTRRDVCFAMATRQNMTATESRVLRPVETYTRSDTFDALRGPEYEERAWTAVHGWFVRRDVATAIGGFDPAVLVSEDIDLCDRVIHYLRRNRLQQVVYGLVDIHGYHVYHPTSELPNAGSQSMAIIKARGARLARDPASAEDVIPTRLDSIDALRDDLRQTKPPPAAQRYREGVVKKVTKRCTLAFKVLAGIR